MKLLQITLFALAILTIFAWGFYPRETEGEAERPQGNIIIGTCTENCLQMQPKVSKYEKQEAELAELRKCESTNGKFMVGDGGDSNGWYHWQKPSLEDVMSKHNGKRVALTDTQYQEIVHNFEEIHYWTRYAYFDLGQTWRWVICHEKINK